MTRASGWCLELGGGGHKRCRVPDVCGCECHETAKNKAIRAAKHPVLNVVGAVESGADKRSPDRHLEASAGTSTDYEGVGS